MSTDYEDDDAEGAGATAEGVWEEFDCPSCNANNPWPDGFKGGDEVSCHYCGSTFLARVSESGRLKFKEI